MAKKPISEEWETSQIEQWLKKSDPFYTMLIKEDYTIFTKAPSKPKYTLDPAIAEKILLACSLILDNLEPNGILPLWIVPRVKRIANELHTLEGTK